MKKLALLTLVVATAFAQAQTDTQNLQVNFAKDNAAKWDGVTIPTGQQCRFDKGVNPTTPALTVSHIPAGATSLVFVYSDHSYTPMNNGGHGLFEYTLPKESNGTVEVPSIASNTFDIPNDFKVIAEHRGTSKGEAGAYMPPCSGGTNHDYFVTVQAVKGKAMIAETTLALGSY